MLSPRLVPSVCLIFGSIAVVAQPSFAQWQMNGVAVCQYAGNQVTPQIVSDGAGGAIMTWKDHRGFNYDIWAQRVDAVGGAQWTADGVAVCTGNGEHDMPVIVSDGSGGAIITWKDHRGSNYDIYAQRLNASGTPQWATDGVVVCNGDGEHDSPAIVSDGAGGAIISWTDYRSGTHPDVYAQRMSAGGASQWTANGVGICTASNDQVESRMVSDGASGAIIVWQDLRSNSYWDVYAQHVLSSGAVDGAWPINGLGVCTTFLDQVNPELTSDGGGGAIVTWRDYRANGNAGLYVHHVLNSGTLDGAWPILGLGVDTDLDNPQHQQIIPDGANGAIIAWAKEFNSPATVYVHHVWAGGTLDGTWPYSGRGVSGSLSTQDFPQLVSDGMGGAIVAWQDYGTIGTASYDIYAQHVYSYGGRDLAWSADGRALCLAAGDQVAPQIVSDGAAGVIAAWEDDRNGSSNADIFAMRVYGSGDLAAVTPEQVEGLRVSPPSPNPARAVVSIGFDLPTEGSVSVGVYDVSGHLLRTLAAARRFPAGSHGLIWDGRTGNGSSVSPGIYFVRLQTAGASVSRSVVWLR
jgi:hypothetical protein